MAQRTRHFPLKGGLDLVSPYTKMPPGRCLTAKNYELLPQGGYRRMDGMRQYLGTQLLHDEVHYYIYEVTHVSGPTLSGASYEADGTSFTTWPTQVIINGGTYYGGSPVVLGGKSGGQEYLLIVPRASQYIHVAGDQIKVMPGGELANSVFDVTAVDLFAAKDVDYDGAGYNVRHGVFSASVESYYTASRDTNLNGSPGVILGEQPRPVTGAGMFGGVAVASVDYDAAYASPYALNFSEPGISSGWLAVSFSGLDDPRVTGGSWEFVQHNFGGHSSTKKLYGCDGKNKAVEIWTTEDPDDPDSVLNVFGAAITTGMATDTPTHAAAHKSHLFLSFPGGSLQHSPPGDPTGTWSVVVGAGELGIGSEIVALESLPGGVLAIFCNDKLAILRGSSVLDWQLEILYDSTGAREGSIQSIPQPYYVGIGGVESMTASQQFGDFETGFLSDNIEPWLRPRLNKITASVVCREKSQYRIFFSDGWALYGTFSRGELVGWMPVKLPFTVNCAWSSVSPYGGEIVIVGTDTGRVYKMDAGINIDDQAIDAYFRLPFGHLGGPRQIKRWRKAAFDLKSNDSTAIEVQPEFGGAGTDNELNPARTLTVTAATPDSTQVGNPTATGSWDEAEWGEFYDDGQILSQAELPLYGSSVDMSLVVRSSTATENPHTISGVTLHYSGRRMKR